MTNKTAWSQSSLLSDRVKPRNYASPTPKNRGKEKDSIVQEPVRSAAVHALETTISKLQRESGAQKDPNGGCFCLARIHDLSTYCPICLHCGLILCSLNVPYYACPHCSALLFSPSSKISLLDRLRACLADTIAKEEEDAERAREEARQAAGSFPSLNSAATSQSLQMQSAQTHTHKVLSLNSKTKRVTVASYTPTSAPAKASTRSESAERDRSPERIPPPPRDMAISGKIPDSTRPWQNLQDGGFCATFTYVRDPHADRGQLREERKARKKSKEDNALGGSSDGCKRGEGSHAPEL